LSFANSTMTAAHEVSAEREPINIAENCNNTLIFASINLTSPFLEKINCNNNLLLMHMSINCHLLTSRWKLLTKLAQREPINIAEKRQQYFDICEYRF